MSSVTITANSGAVSDQRCKGPTTSITNSLPSVYPWVTDIYCHGAHTLSLTESRVLEVPPHWLSDGLGCVPTTQQIALSSVFPVGVQDRDWGKVGKGRLPRPWHREDMTCYCGAGRKLRNVQVSSGRELVRAQSHKSSLRF